MNPVLLLAFLGATATAQNVYSPVCASDGRIYKTYHEVRCISECTGNPNMMVVKNGLCTKCCECTEDVEPVCGNNGVTYSNICKLNCAHNYDKRIQLAYKGVCDPKCYDMCHKIYKPVCGSDGVTYFNKEIFDCACHTNHRLFMKHKGECPCSCNNVYQPVCGTNGVTYDNQCTFECKRKASPSLTLKHTGACSSLPCPECPFHEDPVCGSDGNSYLNDCILNCAKRTNTELSLAHYGLCPQEHCGCYL